MRVCVHVCVCGGVFCSLGEERTAGQENERGGGVRDGDKDRKREHARDAERRGGSLLLTVSLSLPQITAISGKVRS